MWRLFKKLVTGQDEVRHTVIVIPKCRNTGLGAIDIAAMAIHAELCVENFGRETNTLAGI